MNELADGVKGFWLEGLEGNYVWYAFVALLWIQVLRGVFRGSQERE